MISFVYDSNCLVALYQESHVHHAATMADWRRRQQASEELICPVPCFLECFAVLTRLPEPQRFTPAEAWTMLEANLKGRRLVSLTPEESWRELRDKAAQGFRGGLIYDAIIAACVRKAGADTLVTWNLRHFAGLGEFEVVNPLGERATPGDYISSLGAP